MDAKERPKNRSTDLDSLINCQMKSFCRAGLLAPFRKVVITTEHQHRLALRIGSTSIYFRNTSPNCGPLRANVITDQIGTVNVDHNCCATSGACGLDHILASLRIAAASSLASASDRVDNPPKPMSRFRP
jgi:hypothetical protein